ncbi:glycosyltransferase, partial [Streptococcus gallolyticus subsp. gallolyticus]|uniref:glycosyltransferase n=1 Tax=Streptococcus gallolyticus TaxID=315405 RepID=UPI002284319A
SPNDSFNEVKRALGDKKNIIYIKSEENLGFAKGNNLGFMYAKEKIFPDFIIVINNDTEIHQESFQNVIVEKYERYSFYILGPDIVTLDGFHQNPGEKQSWSKAELREFRIKRRLENFLLHLKLDKIRERLVKPKANIYH